MEPTDVGNGRPAYVIDMHSGIPDLDERNGREDEGRGLHDRASRRQWATESRRDATELLNELPSRQLGIYTVTPIILVFLNTFCSSYSSVNPSRSPTQHCIYSSSLCIPPTAIPEIPFICQTKLFVIGYIILHVCNYQYPLIISIKLVVSP